MKNTKRVLYVLSAIAGVFIFAIVSWVFIEANIDVTSRPTFCVSCHPMEPMVASYHKSLHGGNNPRGVTADCTDCHVTHESLPAHILGKARSGTHDFWVMYTRDTSKLDWEAKRLRREEYVYDSGCLTCHQKLEDATKSNPKAFIAHRAYFRGATDDHCVTCHEHVGHKDISDYLVENQ